MTGCVYFVEEGADGPIKIGFTSTSATDRLIDLQRGNSRALTLIGLIPDCDRQDELSWHKRFKKNRLNGEWFSRTPELVASIHQHALMGDEMREEMVALDWIPRQAIAIVDWATETGRTIESLAEEIGVSVAQLNRALVSRTYYWRTGFNLQISKRIAAISGGRFSVDDLYYQSAQNQRSAGVNPDQAVSA